MATLSVAILVRDVETGAARDGTKIVTSSSRQAMIDLYNAETNQLIGTISEDDLQVLTDGLEEESSQDQDYYIESATIELLADDGASEDLLGFLRAALGSTEGVEIRWQRRE